MSAGTPDDLDALAGEYVLGTLDLGERRAVAARRQREPALNDAIEAWETRLAPLAEAAPGIAPPDDLWDQVEDALGSPLAATFNIMMLNKRIRAWKTATYVAASFAAGLVLVIGGQWAFRPAAPSQFVAVLQKDAASPAFIVSVNVSTRQLTVRPVAADRPAGKSYELWLVNDKYDGPKSLGLIQNANFTTTEKLQTYSDADVQTSVLAVSLEPEGGSTTGKPTGPVLFAGKLVQATP